MFGRLPLAGERELGDLGPRQRDHELAAGGTAHRVLEAMGLAQPSQKGQASEVGLARLFDEHL